MYHTLYRNQLCTKNKYGVILILQPLPRFSIPSKIGLILLLDDRPRSHHHISNPYLLLSETFLTNF